MQGRLEEIARHLHKKAPEWFPELGAAVRPRLVRSVFRGTNLLHRFDLVSDRGTRSVVVKIFVPRPLDASRPFEHWPRLEPSPSIADSPRAEYEALAMVHATFSAIGDPALGSVRALDVLPEAGVLILSLAPGTPLDRWACAPGPFATASRRRLVETGLANAGRWLRAFHESGDPRAGAPLRTRRDELLASIREIASYLVDRGERPDFVRAVVARTEELAQRSLPDALPVGLGHGDYWPRNILVEADGRITAVDTYARWRTAIYGDIAYFLVNLDAAPCQLATLGTWIGRGTLRSYRAAFLGGYFGTEPPPHDAIRPFEVLALLNKWGLAAFNLLSSQGTTRPTKRVKMAVRRRHFMGLLAAATR